MHDKPVETLRKGMLILGLLLLMVFGTLAAAQARDKELAGAVQHRVKTATGDALSFLGFKDVTPVAQPAASAQQAVSQAPASNHSAAAQVPSGNTNAKTLPSTASNKAADVTNSANNNANSNANNALGKVTTDAAKKVQQVQEQVNDLTRIWP